MLVALCDIFWCLAKPAQDALLWSLQSVQAPAGDASNQSSCDSSSNSSTRHCVRWFIAGIEVCRRAFLRFLGVGSARIDRTRRTFHGMDQRTLSGPGTVISAASFDLFYDDDEIYIWFKTCDHLLQGPGMSQLMQMRAWPRSCKRCTTASRKACRLGGSFARSYLFFLHHYLKLFLGIP